MKHRIPSDAPNAYSIGGIQQVGIGLVNLPAGWKLWRTAFGFDCQILREMGPATYMRPYTGGKIEERNALLAVNLNGGGGVELWQYTSRPPVAMRTSPLPGDLGIYALKLKCRDAARAHRLLNNTAGITCSPINGEYNNKQGNSFFCRDSAGNMIHICECSLPLGFSAHPIGGVDGAIIGCSDIDKARTIYSSILGYDSVMCDSVMTYDRHSFLLQTATRQFPSAGLTIRRVLLGQTGRGSTPFARLFGATNIELWQRMPRGASLDSHIFHGRQWGDEGYIHVCFEVKNIDAIRAKLRAVGRALTVDTEDTFNMGEAGGRFAYLEDYDGTLIELVETHRLKPISSLPWTIHANRLQHPIPKFFLRGLSFSRVKK